MSESESLFIFRLDEVRYAIPLGSAERVIPAVEVTPLSERGGRILGVINLHGKIVPVIDSRRLLGLPEREIVPDDVFVIARTSMRTLALVADAVEPVASLAEERITPAVEILLDVKGLTGIARLENEIILIHDLEKCISEEDADVIDRCIEEAALRC